MIEKPKKERRFLKTLGKIGEILLEEVLIKVGSNLIKRIGGKKTLPSILFLFLSISLYGQYPATGNKQRLGYQTTGDGLVYRGRALDTMTIKSSGLNNAYFILDTVNNILYNYIKTKGGWQFNNGDTVIINNTVDTTSLSNRINLKVNISDTASMLLPYLRKADTASMLTPYFRDADTTSLNLVSRFATKLNISDTSAMLTNYLRSGVAASTYLPLAGGTITGTINRADQFNDGSPLTAYYNILNYFARRDNVKGNQTAQITFTDRPGTSTFPNNVRTSDIYLMTAKNFSGGQLGQYLDTTISVVANQDGGRLGISNLNPLYKLDVNGTLGVTGATTLSNLSGSGTRMVTASSTGLLSTQSIPIGTVTGTGTTNYLPIFTGSSSLGNSSIYDNGNIGIGTNNPTVALDILNSTSAQSAKIRLSTEFASAVRTLTIGSGDGIIWDLPGSTSQSPYIDIIGGDNSVGGGNFIIKTQSSNRFTVRQNGNVGINTTTPSFLLDVNGTTGLQGALTVNNATVLNEDSGDFDTRIESNTNANMVFVDAGQDRVGIGTASPSKTLDVNGEVRIATVTATPTALLGKDGSNVVGEVTDINQSGVMKVGSTTQNTSSVGIINVAHGLSYTPTKVIATIAQQSSYVIVCHGITSSNLNFTIYDSTDGTALDNVSVGFFWIAFK
jgi:hypothetical protein